MASFCISRSRIPRRQWRNYVQGNKSAFCNISDSVTFPVCKWWLLSGVRHFCNKVSEILPRFCRIRSREEIGFTPRFRPRVPHHPNCRQTFWARFFGVIKFYFSVDKIILISIIYGVQSHIFIFLRKDLGIHSFKIVLQFLTFFCYMYIQICYSCKCSILQAWYNLNFNA